ncbi:hypothetical protein [Tepidibacter mesophilus]|nr:hypothetical protein [Tepidibacter mesophilus]
MKINELIEELQQLANDYGEDLTVRDSEGFKINGAYMFDEDEKEVRMC